MGYFGITAGAVRIGGQQSLPASRLRVAFLNRWFELLRLKIQNALDCHGLLDN